MISRRSALLLTGGALLAEASPRHARAEAMMAPRALVIGHRGASALRPEHTLASYAKAIADGADYVEPDLVPTKDGVLVCRHEPDITETTNVADLPQFASRKRTARFAGFSRTGWFTTDFTLAELKTLRARERLPKIRPHNTRYDDRFDIPTFVEMIDFVAAESATRGRVIGIIPEIKLSTYFHTIGQDPETTFLETIAAHEYTRQGPLELQSFETANIRRIGANVKAINPQARIMLLLGAPHEKPLDVLVAGGQTTFGDLMTPDGLKGVAEYADVIGPPNTDLIPRDASGAWLQPTTLVRDAHRAGLLVHSYTARPENCFLPAQLRNNAGPNARNVEGSIAEIRAYLDMGLDGFFTDDPAIGRMAVDGAGA